MSEMYTDPRDPVAPDAKLEQHNKALAFAQLYYATFVENKQGAQILEHWDKTLRRKRVPVNAPITEYAAVEAVRDFVEKIYAEIEFARSGRV